MSKKVIDYSIPIQGKKECEKYNSACEDMFGEDFTPLMSTEEHIDILFQKLNEAIQKVGDEGGWYVSDGIKVKIEIEYEPENK